MNPLSIAACNLLALTLGTCAVAAQAAIYTVGAGCPYTSVQAAVNAVPASGAHEIRITNAATHEQQAISISARNVTLRGGYVNCSEETPSGGNSILSGQNGGNDSVLTIRGSNNNITLERLNLIRGDEVYDGYGGGIDFKGSGTLTLRTTALSQNYAGYGGGISVVGEGGNAVLRLETGTTILLNTAQFSGGGVRLEGTAQLTMNAPDSTIASNEALGLNPTNSQPQYGYGGGVQVIAPATATIGSSGIGNGAIVGNSARYGGGIAVNGGDQDVDARVTLYSTNPTLPMRVHGNRASNTGGGIYLGTNLGVIDISLALLCAYDIRIDSNIAAEGSALYLDSDYDPINQAYGAFAAINRNTGFPSFCSAPAGSVRCAAGSNCNTMQGNRSEDSLGSATPGAAILVQNGGSLAATRLSVRENSGAHVLRAFESDIAIDTLAFAANTSSGTLFRLEDESTLGIVDSTLAGNAIGASQVLSVNGDLDMLRTILWQPGSTSLVQSDGSKTIAQVIASETASLGAGASSLSPRLIDPERGDVRLRAASPAIDFAPAVVGDDVDADSLARDRRLQPVPRGDGFVRDIGAYERQSIAPLVLNGNFDVDLNLWTPATAGTSTRDAAQNAAGASGSGSTRVSKANTFVGESVSGLVQCVHLPGPGTYTLNGWGRGTGNMTVAGDIAQLYWEYRDNGGEGCTQGKLDASGYLFLSNQASWRRPANPLVIEVSAAQWTTTSSVAVTMVVFENSVSGPPRPQPAGSTASPSNGLIRTTASSKTASSLKSANRDKRAPVRAACRPTSCSPERPDPVLRKRRVTHPSTRRRFSGHAR